MTQRIDDLCVNSDISPNDQMFTGDRGHYFRVGQSALDCISRSLEAAQVPRQNIQEILDLPCGHGRVLRYLRASFPGARIIASDVVREGVEFCVRVFGAHPAYAGEDPASIPLERDTFDLIWVGSLFTHLDAPRWTPFFDVFRRTLRPGGVLVFTTHGRTSYDWMVRGVVDYGLPDGGSAMVQNGYERAGFGYTPYSESRPYGHSLSSPAWVIDRIGNVTKMRLVLFCERAWDNHQDVYACVRESN